MPQSPSGASRKELHPSPEGLYQPLHPCDERLIAQLILPDNLLTPHLRGPASDRDNVNVALGAARKPYRDDRYNI